MKRELLESNLVISEHPGPLFNECLWPKFFAIGILPRVFKMAFLFFGFWFLPGIGANMTCPQFFNVSNCSLGLWFCASSNKFVKLSIFPLT